MYGLTAVLAQMKMLKEQTLGVCVNTTREAQNISEAWEGLPERETPQVDTVIHSVSNPQDTLRWHEIPSTVISDQGPV